MDNTVSIERSFNTSLSNLWEHWTNPALFVTWFGPGEAVATANQYEVAEGASYEVLVVEPSGVTHVTTGVFTTVKLHEQLVFTWKIHDLDMQESRVTVHFSGDEHTSTLRLAHEQLTADHAKMHEFGWSSAFSKLVALLG
jgi:uncharacterized protein YndB with AHSA1/START domain